MAAEQGRELRRLAKSHRITFKPPASSRNEWPPRYRNSFDNISKIGAFTYEHFVASIDPHSDQQPWRERTKFRAEWLAKKAGHLVQQQRNEAGWRFGIENDVFQRFGFEVACPECRARLWRSEFEAAVNTFNDDSREIVERRKNRKSCQCPPEKRSHDYYELGTNPLFDDRVQEVLLHNPLLVHNLPKHEPDRVYGLRETNNFKDLFSRPTVRSSHPQGKSIGELVQSSPFKDVSDPLLFPFLIIEAKSEKSSNGFDDISIQTAFPILALLRLQERLSSQVNDVKLDDGPLVWFFANRGDSWRVYGCFVTEEKPTRYNILQLWEGSILHHDKALQLILIVDYVFDWARDVYRPSILRQLKSLTSVDPYDKISVANDSDIFSMRRQISSWIQPPQNMEDPTRGDIIDLSGDESDPLPENSQRILRELSENNGASNSQVLRSPDFTTSRLVGLYFTEANVRSLLQWAGANDHDSKTSRGACRTLVNFVTQWDELMLLSRKEVLDFELLWSGSSSSEKLPPGNETTDVRDTYVLLEYSTYMDASWRIVREITYLAISKEAFGILVETADFSKKHDGVRSITETLRPCSINVLKDVVRCLKSGSVHQTFIAAVICSCYAFSLLPESKFDSMRKRSPAQSIGLERLPHSRLRGIVAKYHAYCQPQISKANNPRNSSPKRPKLEALYHGQRHESYPSDCSFVRLSDKKENISTNEGHLDACRRCVRSGKRISHYAKEGRSPFTDSGSALVAALGFDEYKDGSPVFCLFAQQFTEKMDALDEKNYRFKKETARMLKDVSKSDRIYHTIHHPLPSSYVKANKHYEVRWHSVVWNLPLQKHPLDPRQQEMFGFWPEELVGELLMGLWHNDIKDMWNTLQMSLLLSKAGQSWEQINQTVEKHRKEVENSLEENASVRGWKKVNGIIDMRARLYALYAKKARKEGWRGHYVASQYYIPAQNRGSAEKLCWRDGNVSEYDGCTLNFLRSRNEAAQRKALMDD